MIINVENVEEKINGESFVVVTYKDKENKEITKQMRVVDLEKEFYDKLFWDTDNNEVICNEHIRFEYAFVEKPLFDPLSLKEFFKKSDKPDHKKMYNIIKDHSMPLSNFGKIIFKNNVMINQCIFNKGFIDSLFSSFSHLFFEDQLNFTFSYINSSTSFRITCSKNANFLSTYFDGFTDFIGSIFRESVIFKDSYFNDCILCLSTKFDKDVYFSYSIFEKSIIFEKTNFNAYTSFESSNFKDETHFYSVLFSKDVDFKNTQFDNKVEFNNTQFCGDISNFNFIRIEKNIQFWQEVISKKTFLKSAYFGHIHPSNDRSLVFKDVSMENVSFYKSYIDKMDFVHVKWASEKLNGLERYIVFDETRDDIDLKECQRQYQALRNHYDNKKDFDSSEKFYYSEMETKRKIRENEARVSYFKKFNLIWIYKLLSNYGLSYKRPLIWLLTFVLTIFPLLYFFIGLEKNNQSITYQSLIQNKSADPITYSIKISLFRKDSNYQSPFPFWITVVNLFQILFTGVMVMLIILAIRRQFRR